LNHNGHDYNNIKKCEHPPKKNMMALFAMSIYALLLDEALEYFKL
jgi:hypothetical protein